MKAGRMLLGGAAGFGLGLARAWGDANEDARSKAPKWLKSLAGYKDKQAVPAIQKAEDVAAKPGMGTVQQPPDTPADVGAGSYEDHWKSGEPATPSFPDDGQSAQVETMPLAEQPTFEQAGADLDMENYQGGSLEFDA